MTRGKLIREERAINVYKKTNGKILKDPVTDIKIDFIPLKFLQEIIVAVDDDPLLYSAYELNPEQIEKLNSYLKEKLIPDFTLFEYFLECYGIYE